MKRARNLKTLIVILTGLFMAGCADENPALVYQPPQTETVAIRYLNLSGDNKTRTFSINGTSDTQANYGVLTDTLKPPADSGYVSVKLNGSDEYATQQKIRFVRNTNYTIVSLPSAKGALKPRDTDTLITVMSMYGLNEKPNTAYMKILNANPDSTNTYAMNIGCPSGSLLFASQPYRSVTFFPTEIRSGSVAVSLSRQNASGSEFIGLFNIELKEHGQYTLIVVSNGDKEELWLLDELNTTVQALTPLSVVPERTTKIRAINFSSSDVTFARVPGDIISGSPTGRIDRYQDLGACSSQAQDTLTASVGGTETGRTALSLEVLQKYTVMAFDSAGKKAGLVIAAQPLHLNEPSNGRAIVRVVHGAYTQSAMALTLSLGARNSSLPIGYATGEVLATGIVYGGISDPVFISPGRAPLTLFTATEPAKLVLSTVFPDFKADKSYLVIVNSPDNTSESITVIEDNEENAQVNYLDKGVLTEIVNLVTSNGNAPANIKVEGVIASASVNSASSIATVLLPGTYTLTVNNMQKAINIQTGKKTLVVATGSADNTDMLVFNTDPLTTAPKTYNRRFINAAKDTKISIKLDGLDNPETLVKDLSYGEITQVETVVREKKISLFFLDANNGNKLIYRMNELPLTFGKNYNIILGKNSAGDGYSVVVQQEF